MKSSSSGDEAPGLAGPDSPTLGGSSWEAATTMIPSSGTSPAHPGPPRGASRSTKLLLGLAVLALLGAIAAITVVVMGERTDSSESADDSGQRAAGASIASAASASSPTPTATTPATVVPPTTPSIVTLPTEPPPTPAPTPPPATIPPVEPANSSATTADLAALAAKDFPTVLETLNNRWVAQLSSKRVGLVAEGRTWDPAAILGEHQRLMQEYGPALFLDSSQWGFQKGGYWVTVTAMTFPDGEAANRWCDRNMIPVDNCFGKRIHQGAWVRGDTKSRK